MPRQRASQARDAFARVGTAPVPGAAADDDASEPAAAVNGATESPQPPDVASTAAAPPPPSEASPELDAATLSRWRWQLGATARKAAAARARADAALADWERLAADAAAGGVPRRLVVSAAADADLDPPADT
ncbi:MAG: hypothetical protein ABSF03_33965 [Streptosporangiaceae bacterium]